MPGGKLRCDGSSSNENENQGRNKQSKIKSNSNNRKNKIAIIEFCLFVSQCADLQVQFDLSISSICQVETGRMEQFAIQQTFVNM